MKFLSLSRPWDWAIFDPVARKHIENRTWAPPIAMIDQEIALQSAKSWDEDAFRFFDELGISNYPARYDQYPSGIIRGVVTLDRVVTETKTLAPDQARWFFGPYGWCLDAVTPFETFAPCKGAQGLRDLPADAEVAVQHEIAKIRGSAPAARTESPAVIRYRALASELSDTQDAQQRFVLEGEMEYLWRRDLSDLERARIQHDVKSAGTGRSA